MNLYRYTDGTQLFPSASTGNATRSAQMEAPIQVHKRVDSLRLNTMGRSGLDSGTVATTVHYATVSYHPEHTKKELVPVTPLLLLGAHSSTHLNAGLIVAVVSATVIILSTSAWS